MLKIKPWCSTSMSNELLAQTLERARRSGAVPCVSKTIVLLHEKKAMSYTRGVRTLSRGGFLTNTLNFRFHLHSRLAHTAPRMGPAWSSVAAEAAQELFPVVLLELRVVSSTARHLGKHFSMEGMLLS